MPDHPMADAQGFVYRAAVDENEEMIEMTKQVANTKITLKRYRLCGP